MNKFILILIALLPLFSQSKTEMTVHLKKGQILDVVAASMLNDEARKNVGPKYFSKIVPLAGKYSWGHQLSFLAVKESKARYNPRGFGLYTWDSEKQFRAFAESEPEWPPLKAMRPQFWQFLRVNHFVVDKNMTLTFKQDKIYRFTYLWEYGYKNDRQNLKTYQSAMKKVMDQLGVKILVHFNKGISFESMTNDREPDQFSITEWPNEAAYQAYLNSPEFEANKAYFFKSVAEIQAFDAKAGI